MQHNYEASQDAASRDVNNPYDFKGVEVKLTTYPNIVA
jgi:uncharacterized protein YajQ (UPF0234 family)